MVRGAPKLKMLSINFKTTYATHLSLFFFFSPCSSSSSCHVHPTRQLPFLFSFLSSIKQQQFLGCYSIHWSSPRSMSEPNQGYRQISLELAEGIEKSKKGSPSFFCLSSLFLLFYFHVNNK